MGRINAVKSGQKKDKDKKVKLTPKGNVLFEFRELTREEIQKIRISAYNYIM